MPPLDRAEANKRYYEKRKAENNTEIYREAARKYRATHKKQLDENRMKLWYITREMEIFRNILL